MKTKRINNVTLKPYNSSLEEIHESSAEIETALLTTSKDFR